MTFAIGYGVIFVGAGVFAWIEQKRPLRVILIPSVVVYFAWIGVCAVTGNL